MRTIPEKDWKHMRSMKPRVSNDACARILPDVEAIAQKRDGRNHEAYLALWALLKKKDAEIASMFDDFKRSTAVFKLAAWYRYDLVSENEFTLFTEETQNTVKAINETLR
jgi:hypothetical protein